MDKPEEAAFEAFVADHGRRLMKIAVLVTGDLGHAEDLVQITLERVARRWNRLDGAPEAYARAVLTNLAVDRWRRIRRRVAEVALTPLTDRPTNIDIAVQVVASHEALDVLRAMPPRQRAVVVLRYLEDLTEQETADVLNISIGTVKSTASRALARLRLVLPQPVERRERAGTETP